MFLDQLVIRSDPLHVLTTKGKENTSRENIQIDQSSPETVLEGLDLGQNGSLLSNFIKLQGNNPPLEKINLLYYLMPESKWAELLQFTSKCKNLRQLELGYNTIGEARYWLTQSIRVCGNNSPFEQLHLNNCAIPEQGWDELLQSLSSCKQLSSLSLSENNIGDAGHYLVHAITSWGDHPPLKALYLCNCSMPEQVWVNLFQSSSSCKQLCHLDLSGNTIGEAGYYLAQTITSWRDSSLLLKHIDLSSCSMPEQVWTELLQSLSSCKQLILFTLEWSTVTGCLSNFLSDEHTGLPSLEYLHLEHTAMNNLDLECLTYLIRNNKLPTLKKLHLKEENWADKETELQQLKESCQEKIGLDLWLNNHLIIASASSDYWPVPFTEEKEKKTMKRSRVVIITLLKLY